VLPKADLHVHLVGSVAPHTVAALAQRHPEHGVPADVDELREFFAFRDFPHFLRVYSAVSDLVRVPVVLGSDDPPMFGTTLLEEYRRARDEFGLTTDQIRALARASVAPAPVKRRLLAPTRPSPGRS
jgi:aminodeoxyfutalosine deaminase